MCLLPTLMACIDCIFIQLLMTSRLRRLVGLIGQQLLLL